MATLHHNITGELTKELLAAGDGVSVAKISFTNIHATNLVSIDLYIEKKLTGKFYLLKALSIPAGSTLIYDDIRFSNASGEFGLYIKLTKSASETPTVDVILQ